MSPCCRSITGHGFTTPARDVSGWPHDCLLQQRPQVRRTTAPAPRAGHPSQGGGRFFLRYPADYSGSAAINPKTPRAGSGFMQHRLSSDRVAGINTNPGEATRIRAARVFCVYGPENCISFRFDLVQLIPAPAALDVVRLAGAADIA